MKKQVKKKKYTFWIVLMITLGSLLLMYPIYANLTFKYYADKSEKEYEETVASKNEAYKEEQLAAARSYNSTLLPDALIDPFSSGVQAGEIEKGYFDTFNLLTVNGIEGAMGYLEIPKIDVKLPVYHGTSDNVLENGAGHLIGSSFPTGETGTHAVLSSHSGLTGAKLFTDLEKLEIGDQFIFTLFDEKMAYEVDNITVIEPTDTSWFTIDPDKDEITLLTCTPIGINSHRLLVTGHRIPYEEVKEVTPVVDWYIVGVACILALLLGFVIYRAWKKHRDKTKYVG